MVQVRVKIRTPSRYIEDKETWPLLYTRYTRPRRRLNKLKPHAKAFHEACTSACWREKFFRHDKAEATVERETALDVLDSDRLSNRPQQQGEHRREKGQSMCSSG